MFLIVLDLFFLFISIRSLPAQWIQTSDHMEMRCLSGRMSKQFWGRGLSCTDIVRRPLCFYTFGSVSISNWKKIFIVGALGGVFRSTDYGKTWEKCNTGFDYSTGVYSVIAVHSADDQKANSKKEN
jgi:hypothetical protein